MTVIPPLFLIVRDAIHNQRANAFGFKNRLVNLTKSSELSQVASILRSFGSGKHDPIRTETLSTANLSK